MSYAIIGFGSIGKALAKAFARKGIAVSVATTRDPESFASEARAIGSGIVPATLAEAVTADVIFLAVRFEAYPDVAKALSSWQGKTIVDVTNAYGVSPEGLGGLPSSAFVAQAFPGAKLVKGFNHLVAAKLDQDPAVNGGQRVVFLASDDDAAAMQIGDLAEKLGFAPIQLGGLSDGGLLVQARGSSWGRLIFKDLARIDGLTSANHPSPALPSNSGDTVSTEHNIQTVKGFFAAAFGGDREGMLALVADDIEWIIPGEDWPLAGTHRGHAALTDLLKTESETMEMTLSEPREFIAQGDRVLVIGYAEGKVKATDKPFKDDWIFAITVRDGKLTSIREYVDTQALAKASRTDASGPE